MAKYKFIIYKINNLITRKSKPSTRRICFICRYKNICKGNVVKGTYSCQFVQLNKDLPSNRGAD